MVLAVYCFGEVLVDMLSSQYTDNTGAHPETFAKYAGGAPANVAVAVAKLGGTAALVGKVGADPFGDFLVEELQSNGVATDHVLRSNNKTALAFVSLDKDGERSFSFYDTDAAHNDFTPEDFDHSVFDAPIIFSFGSSMLAKPDVLASTTFALQQAKKQSSISCMDVNYREGFWPNVKTAANVIDDIANEVDIIKASKEELLALYGVSGQQEKVAEWIARGTSLVVVTDGANAISYSTQTLTELVQPPMVKVNDTTAAGDAFVGGLLNEISNSCSNAAAFARWVSNKEALANAVHTATICGAFATTKFGAFASLPSHTDLLNSL